MVKKKFKVFSSSFTGDNNQNQADAANRQTLREGQQQMLASSSGSAVQRFVAAKPNKRPLSTADEGLV